MAMSWIWVIMVVLSLLCGLYTGNLDAAAEAARVEEEAMKLSTAAGVQGYLEASSKSV